jgi:transcriptional regulator with XRE-family HTH domain
MHNVDGRRRLATWLERSRLNQRQAARLFGVHHTHVNQILKGRRVPGLANAVVIERVTGIPVGAWLPTTVGEPAARRSRKRPQAA